MDNVTSFSGPHSEAVTRMEKAVLEAARYLSHAASSGEALDVQYKADQTIVMNLDLESQRRILAELGTLYPIVAEEDESSHSLIYENGSYFLVDPLDGTTSCKRFLGQMGGHVGYGPLVGFVHEHRLSAAAFYSIPHQALFTAVKGHGCYVVTPDISSHASAIPLLERVKLVVQPVSSLSAAGMLFFISKNGEAKVVEFLKNRNALDNIYRFGGFANDSARLAQGFEQVQLQFLAKPWDFSAVLLAEEAGCEVWADPMGARVPLSEWRIQNNNPIVSVVPTIRDELFSHLDDYKKT